MVVTEKEKLFFTEEYQLKNRQGIMESKNHHLQLIWTRITNGC